MTLRLACGSSAFLWAMTAFFQYDARASYTAAAVHGFRLCATVITGVLIAACAVVAGFYELNKRTTLRMADQLTVRRKTDGFGRGYLEAPVATSQPS